MQQSDITKKNLILYRDGDKYFYCLNLWVPAAHVIGEMPKMLNGFAVTGPYYMCRVLEHRRDTGEIKIHIDPMKISNKDYGLWLSWHGDFFAEQNIKYLYINNTPPPPKQAPVKGLFEKPPF